MKIKMNWKYAKGEFDTDTVKMLCIPARGRREFGSDEIDASLCIGSGMNLAIAEIHTGNVDSSNALCKEIVRRWNGFEEWHSVEDKPEQGKVVNVKLEDGRYTNSWLLQDGTWAFNLEPTHWKPINEPKGVEK